MNLLDNIFRQVFDVKENALSLIGLYPCHFSTTHNLRILRCPYSIGPKVQNFVIFHPILSRANVYPILWIYFIIPKNLGSNTDLLNAKGNVNFSVNNYKMFGSLLTC